MRKEAFLVIRSEYKSYRIVYVAICLPITAL